MSVIKNGGVFLACLIGLPLAAWLLPGITVTSWMAVLVSAVLLGLFWMIVRPILRFLAFPLNFLSFGLLGIVVDTMLFWVVVGNVPGIHIASFWWALAAAVIVGIIQGLTGGRD